MLSSYEDTGHSPARIGEPFSFLLAHVPKRETEDDVWEI